MKCSNCRKSFNPNMVYWAKLKDNTWIHQPHESQYCGDLVDDNDNKLKINAIRCSSCDGIGSWNSDIICGDPFSDEDCEPCNGQGWKII